MIPNEIVVLFIVAFIVIPVIVETENCIYPTPSNNGAICKWEDKEWDEKFDLKTKKYYYVLRETDKTDNFVEKKVRKRYIEKGKRFYISKQK